MRTVAFTTGRSHFYRLLVGGFVLLAMGASTARAWWDDAWTVRKQITLDPAAGGVTAADAVGDTPVLIRLFDGNFHFSDLKDDGSDLRIVAGDDKTSLPYHFEKFDPVLNEAFVWVRVPGLKVGAKTPLWLYFGNVGGKAPKVEDAKATYDPAMALVYHFTEHGTPASDYSMNGNAAQTAGLSTDGSMIGGGLRLDGHAVVTIPASPTLTWAAGAPFTWTAWVRFVAPQANAVIFNAGGAKPVLSIGFDNGVPFVELAGATAPSRSAAGARVAANTWHHLAVVASGTATTLYLDGTVYATLNVGIPALSAPFFIGGDGPTAAAGVASSRPGFIGELDELGLAKAARSAGFIQFAAVSQGGGDGVAKLLAFGDEEQPKSWFSFLKNGYVGVIIGSLTVDGWVVIGILAVMSVISWAVMIAKGGYLGKIGRGNAHFLKEWSQVATDLSVLDHGDEDKAKTLGGRVDPAGQRLMRNSPLYKIYHLGVREIGHRLSTGRRGSAKILSARSIQAIRASLDGGMVRESQKLNRMMVLLTIAISGGPFLGLLGTVVGVMITFAAVAQAGEVNVNAIAPGIAAALAATVAGLAVAIPALFGYNYLVTRIKSESSDMQVFIDEFVAKMAEFYSDTAEAERTLTRAPFAPSEPR